MNKELRKKEEKECESELFKPMNSAVFGKTMETVRKHRAIKLVTTERRKTTSCQNQSYKKMVFGKPFNIRNEKNSLINQLI